MSGVEMPEGGELVELRHVADNNNYEVWNQTTETWTPADVMFNIGRDSATRNTGLGVTVVARRKPEPLTIEHYRTALIEAIKDAAAWRKSNRTPAEGPYTFNPFDPGSPEHRAWQDAAGAADERNAARFEPRL